MFFLLIFERIVLKKFMKFLTKSEKEHTEMSLRLEKMI